MDFESIVSTNFTTLAFISGACQLAQKVCKISLRPHNSARPLYQLAFAAQSESASCSETGACRQAAKSGVMGLFLKIAAAVHFLCK